MLTEIRLNLLRIFSRLSSAALRRKIWLLKKVSISEFILSVFISELTTMLIKNDMKVSDEKVRIILKKK